MFFAVRHPIRCPIFTLLVIGCVLGLATGRCIAEELTVEVQLIPIEPSVVAAARSGLVNRVHVKQGQAVRSDDLVAELDASNAALELEKAETDMSVAKFQAQNNIDIRHAEKTRDLAKTELGRAVAINQKVPGSVSQREIDSLRLTSERAELAIEQANRDREVAKLEYRLSQIARRVAALNVEQHRLKAPVDGVVVEVHRRAGEWVESGEGVIEITPTDLLRAEGFVEVSASTRIPRGAPAVLLVREEGVEPAPLRGSLVFIAPDANPVNGLVRFRAEFERRGRPLRAGMVGLTRLELLEAGDAKAEPVAASAPAADPVKP